MIADLPPNIRRLLTKYGVEGDSISSQEDSLLIELDDLEVAFKLRESMLDLHSCCLINNNGYPALLIHNILI